MLLVFLVYPIIDTLLISLMNSGSTAFVGLDNYIHVFSQADSRDSLLNNLLWLLLFTFGAAGLGLLMAALADRVRYAVVVKALIFVPMTR